MHLTPAWNRDNTKVVLEMGLLESSRFLINMRSREETTDLGLPENKPRKIPRIDPNLPDIELFPVYETFTYFGIWDQVRGVWVAGPIKLAAGVTLSDTAVIPAPNQLIAVVSTPADCRVKLFRLPDLTEVHSFPADYYNLHPNGDLIALFRGGKVSIWSAKRGLISDATIDGETCSFDPTGRLIAVGRIDVRQSVRRGLRGGRVRKFVATDTKPTVGVWSLENARKLYDLTAVDVAFSRDGRRVFLAEADGVTIREALTHREILRLPVKGGSLAVSPDGRAIAALGGKLLHIWFADSPETSPPPE